MHLLFKFIHSLETGPDRAWIMLLYFYLSFFPFSSSGKRPMGRGLFSWLYNYFAHGVGVLGYDPILGALSPPFRVLIHVAFMLFTWSTVVAVASFVVPPTTNEDGADNDGVSVGTCGMVATTFYLVLMYIVHYCMPAVSQPGGPRPHKIQRHPAWTPGPRYLPTRATKSNDNTSSTFTYQQSAASHATTEARFAGTAAFLTGEQAGRDIWTETTMTATKADNKRQRVDEKLVEELARGGREHFGALDPSVNPNSTDQIFRAQCIREYLAAGNKPPETKKKPETIEQALERGVHYYSMLQVGTIAMNQEVFHDQRMVVPNLNSFFQS